jgi:hypothetical protein
LRTPESVGALIANGEVLPSVHGGVTPALSGVVRRSVNLNWRGPTVTLRIQDIANQL